MPSGPESRAASVTTGEVRILRRAALDSLSPRFTWQNRNHGDEPSPPRGSAIFVAVRLFHFFDPIGSKK
jgi:hypothetical protein